MKKFSIPLLIFTATIPLIAGFFAWQKKSFDLKDLSTRRASKSGAIMEAKQGIPLFGFLKKSFGAHSLSQTDTSSNVSYYEPLSSMIKNLERGTFAVPPAENLQGDTRQQTEALPEPSEEPARSVYHYFIVSSAVGFGNTTETLPSALSRAAQGDPFPLTALITELSGQLNALRELNAPPEIASIHERSNLLLFDYINFLKRIAESPAQDTASLWKSQEHARLVQEAASILQTIRSAEITYNFTLPADVLPR